MAHNKGKGSGIHREGPYTNHLRGSHPIVTPFSSRDHYRVGKDKGILNTDGNECTPIQRFIREYTLQAKGWGKGRGSFATFVGEDIGDGEMEMNYCDHAISFDPHGNMVIEPPLPCPRCMPAQQQEHANEDVGVIERPQYPDWTFPDLSPGMKGNSLGKGMGQGPSKGSSKGSSISG